MKKPTFQELFIHFKTITTCIIAVIFFTSFFMPEWLQTVLLFNVILGTYKLHLQFTKNKSNLCSQCQTLIKGFQLLLLSFFWWHSLKIMREMFLNEQK